MFRQTRQTRFEQFRMPAREMKKRGPLDQFFKPAPAVPLQQDLKLSKMLPCPSNQQSPPPPLPPPKKARTALQQDPAAAVYSKRYRSVRWGSTRSNRRPRQTAYDKRTMDASTRLPLPCSQRRAASSCISGKVAPTVSLGEIQPVSPRRLLYRLCTIWTRRSHAGSASVTHVCK